MRMFPAVPEGIRRITPSMGATISGHFIPADVSSTSYSFCTLTNPLPIGQSQHSPLRSLPPSPQLQLSLHLRPRTLAPLLAPATHLPLRLRQKRSAPTLFRRP
jgi:hypothetical protein